VFDEINAYRVLKASYTDDLAGTQILSIANGAGTHEVGVQLAGGNRSDYSQLPGLFDWKGSNIVRGSHPVGSSGRLPVWTALPTSASASSKRPAAGLSTANTPTQRRNRILLQGPPPESLINAPETARLPQDPQLVHEHTSAVPSNQYTGYQSLQARIDAEHGPHNQPILSEESEDEKHRRGEERFEEWAMENYGNQRQN